MKHGDVGILEKQYHLGFADVEKRLLPLFRRSEAHENACGYVRGLLSCIERKNGWQLSEAVGRPTPYAIQHLLDRCKWSGDALRDELHEYVKDHLGSTNAVAILDETEDRKNKPLFFFLPLYTGKHLEQKVHIRTLMGPLLLANPEVKAV